MGIKSFLFKLFAGYEVLGEFTSEYNGKITVVEDIFGKRSLRAGGLSQSGGLVCILWENALRKIDISKSKNVLILGLGAGTVAQIISRINPFSEIKGVEIDPTIISVAKDYFNLQEIKNLKTTVQDAFVFLRQNTNKFDLILVDLYSGKNSPLDSASEGFFIDIKKSLAEDGTIIVNRLNYNQEFRDKNKIFLEKLKQYFKEINIVNIITNAVYFCKK